MRPSVTVEVCGGPSPDVDVVDRRLLAVEL